MEERICNACGCVIETEAVEIDGLFYCQDCNEFEDYWKTCEHCGKRMYVDSIELQAESGEVFCSDACVTAEDFFQCDNCNRIHREDENTIRSEDGIWVFCRIECAEESDFSRCPHCYNWFPRYELNTTSDYEYVCDSCLELYYFTCSECEENRPNRDLSLEDDYGTRICSHCDYEYCVCEECGRVINDDSVFWHNDRALCEECYMDRDTPINEWNYKPCFDFYSEDEEECPTLYMGVELEVDYGEDPEWLAQKLSEQHSEIYCKHDGSLSEGVEIVSHPCTLRYHTNSLDWPAIMDEASEQGFKSHDTSTCGLHVHVNREYFGYNKEQQDLNIAKVILLVNRFWDSHIVPFSRRNICSLAQWAKKNEVGLIFAHETEQQKKDKVISKTYNRGRYVAVNLQNRNTIEFRIFRGTLKYSTFIATLQFVDTLCRYACTISIDEIDNVRWESIFAGRDYDELREYLEKRTEFNPAKIQNVISSLGASSLGASKIVKPRDEVQVGDLVRIREWDDMKEEFGSNEAGIPCMYYFIERMRFLCGQIGRVKRRCSEAIELDVPETRGYMLSTDMIDVIEEGGM